MKKKKRILPIKASASSETSSSSENASPSANGPASLQEPQPTPQEPQPGTSTGGVTPSCPQVNIQCGSESSDSESDGDHDNDREWRPPYSVPMTARKTSNPSGSITFIMLIGGGLASVLVGYSFFMALGIVFEASLVYPLLYVIFNLLWLQ